MKRQPFFARQFDLSDFVGLWHSGHKMTNVDEWVFDLRMMHDHYTPEYYPSNDDLIKLVVGHLKAKHHLTPRIIAHYLDLIEQDAKRAWGDAYWGQWEGDLIDFLFNRFAAIANDLSLGGKWYWIDNKGKRIDYQYEASGFIVQVTRKQLLEQGKAIGASYTDCIQDADYVYDDIISFIRTDIDPDDFDGRYGHCPDVKDADILACFDDYSETLDTIRTEQKQHCKQVKAYIQNSVPLIKREPVINLEAVQ